MSAGERARLFVALELPASARDILARWRASTLRENPALRRGPVEHLHATLCFLGARPVSQIDAIVAACGVVAGEPVVEPRLGEPVWLPRRRPRVLAVSLEDQDGALARLQATLASALVAGGGRGALSAGDAVSLAPRLGGRALRPLGRGGARVGAGRGGSALGRAPLS